MPLFDNVLKLIYKSIFDYQFNVFILNRIIIIVIIALSAGYKLILLFSLLIYHLRRSPQPLI